MIGRVVLLGVVAGILSALYFSGFFEYIEDAERVRASLDGLGMWAPVLYILAFSCLEPFFVPGFAFIVPGAFVWSYGTLFLLSWLGSIGAGIVGFSFARYLGRDYVEGRLPASLRRYDERLAERGLRTVILVRLTLFLAPPAHWLLGVSQVRFAPFVLGTAIGFLPGIALLTYVVVFLGESLGDFFANQPREFWIGLGVVIVALALVRRRVRRKKSADEAP
jgi:uncharacterized membrane protein YdjX (TVP38/TMEM64 family)